MGCGKTPLFRHLTYMTKKTRSRENMYKKAIMTLLLVAILSCAVAPLVSAANPYVWIAVKDSKGIYYKNCDIYAYAAYVPGIGLSEAGEKIGNTGKTTWLGWNGYRTNSYGNTYKFEARQNGRILGSMWLNLVPKQQNIYIIKGKFVK